MGGAHQPAEFDRPARYEQDSRFFDVHDREIVPGQPLGANAANTAVADRTSVPGPDEKSASTKERESLLKLVIGMAIGGYKWDHSQARITATADIRNDVLAQGLSIDDGTVLKFLRLAAELLPGQRTEPPSNTPKSG